MYRIIPPDEIVDTAISLPLSKSESARTLLMDALADLPLTATVADCDDTRVLQRALSRNDSNGITVNIGAAGTAMRFLTAYYAVTPGTDVVLDGSERMRRRPIAPLVDALKALGADIEYADKSGCAPLHIRGRRLSGGSVTVDATVSSQFISALMMVGAVMEDGLELQLSGEPVSQAYTRMTGAMMEARGIDVTVNPYSVSVRHGAYAPAQADAIGADWSAASYWYTVAALTSGWIALPGLHLPSLQGDSVMAAIGERLGVITAEVDAEDGELPMMPDGTGPVPAGTLQLSASPEQFSRLDYDASDCPDLVPTLAVTAAMLGMPFRITGVSTLRGKETDRLEALVNEALKLGLIFEADGDRALSWDGARMPITKLPVIDTYDDHRIAMAFAPCAVFIPGLSVRDPQVVTKSYPTFWTDLVHAGFTIHQIPDDADPATWMPADGLDQSEGLDQSDLSDKSDHSDHPLSD